MSSPILFPANFKLSVERARGRGNNIAAQNTKPFSRLQQFFVRQCSDKFAVIVFAEFTETDWAGHRDTVGVQRRGTNFSKLPSIWKIFEEPAATTEPTLPSHSIGAVVSFGTQTGNASIEG